MGSEKGAAIGLIRTQELLQGRKLDRAEQFFTRAIDFGYSKTEEETLEFWGREEILGDIVWVIRKFRPDVIITRSIGGHGNHLAERTLTPEAFRAAADPNQYPEQLAYVEPWQATRLLRGGSRFGDSSPETGITLDVGGYNPLLSRSYPEIAAENRSQHKTQGLGRASIRWGSRNDRYQVIDGIPATGDIFDGIDISWNRVPGGRPIGRMLKRIIDTFDPNDPASFIPQLLSVYNELNSLEDNGWVVVKRQELLNVIRSCAGLWMETITNDSSATPGNEIEINTTLVNRSPYPFRIVKVEYEGIASDTDVNEELSTNQAIMVTTTLRLPQDYPIFQPYWLEEESSLGAYMVNQQTMIGTPENPPAVCAIVTLRFDANDLEYRIPLSFRWTDSINGTQYVPFEVRPKVTLHLAEKVSLFPDRTPNEIKVVLTSHSTNTAGTVLLSGSRGWVIRPSSIPFFFEGKDEQAEFVFTVTPPVNYQEAYLTAEALVGDQTFKRDMVRISYPHIDHQVYFPESRMKVVRLDLEKEGNRIGYIMGSGDEIPQALGSIGYDVDLLDDQALAKIDLSGFDAIIVGIRAYNTRQILASTQNRLLDYVENGGTLVVQYSRPNGLVTNDIGPYPFSISSQDRVSDETAPMSFLLPDHQLLNYPNKITAQDFEGWVQERGLNFINQWDDNYEAILSSHDPNEPDREGGLLFARYGSGVFVYTSLAWFRQLPAGVPGAYRLFVNIISAGNYGR